MWISDWQLAIGISDSMASYFYKPQDSKYVHAVTAKKKVPVHPCTEIDFVFLALTVMCQISSLLLFDEWV